MLGHKQRNQLELFITGSLRQFIPDEHVLARVDRVLDLSWLKGGRRWQRLSIHWSRWQWKGSMARQTAGLSLT
jgi:hypothetical protein